MSALHESYIVIEPCQDYEDSIAIMGVFGSLAAAKYAAKGIESDLANDPYRVHRPLSVEIEHWRAYERVETWSLREGKWVYNGATS